MYYINYFRIKDGVQVTAEFSTREAAANWAIATGRPGSTIHQA